MINRFTGEYSFLSNFYPIPGWIEFEGEIYSTTEHAFQAAKTTDFVERQTVREAMTPGKAKRLGRKVTLRPDWDEVRVDVMRRILREKFGDEVLADKLMDTGDEELIEGNTWGDQFWGVSRGMGENWLGRLLMEIRHDLRTATLGRGRIVPPDPYQDDFLEALRLSREE